MEPNIIESLDILTNKTMNIWREALIVLAHDSSYRVD